MVMMMMMIEEAMVKSLWVIWPHYINGGVAVSVVFALDGVDRPHALSNYEQDKKQKQIY